MSKVRILPEILSNQIAAGEVVERPASVVKELIENSIDAGATQVIIEIERGGKSLIRVSDNGSGLERDDALLSIERYATSKIFTKEDLFSISTMGFRGEALPSIASVSRFTMVTRSKHSNAGVKIEIAGGRLVNVEDAGAPVGTMVEVKNLFYNTPARKKFLKTDATEISHIADIISGVALGYPGIRFKLLSNRKIQKDFTDLNNPFLRASSVLGQQAGKRLIPVAFDDDYVRINGFAAHPDQTRSSSGRLYFFVNHRLIYDRGLVSAVFQGYRGRIMKGRFPMAVIFIEIGFDQVDINVHPAKRQVKFFNAAKVYHALSGAVSKAFTLAQKDMHQYTVQSHAPVRTPDRLNNDNSSDNPYERIPIPPAGVEQAVLEWAKPVKADLADPSYSDRHNDVSKTPDFSIDNDRSQGLGKTKTILGQVMGTYIVAASQDGMMLVDQHAAHERILFEKLRKRHMGQGIVSQSLVVPEVIELTHKEANRLETIIKDLETLGFQVEPFGGPTFVVKAIPDLISDKQIQPMIVDIIEASMVDKNAFSKDQWLDECLMLMACHHSIRANQTLSHAEMEKLIQDLEKCDNPMHCPHGRPIRISWGQKQIEKWFKRIV